MMTPTWYIIKLTPINPKKNPQIQYKIENSKHPDFVIEVAHQSTDSDRKKASESA